MANEFIARKGLIALENSQITGSLNVSGSITANNLSGTNTGDQDLSSLATITQLNASSSVLQTNIDASVQPSQTGSFLTAADTGSLITTTQTSSFLTAADTGSLTTTAELNASSSALQTNIDAKASIAQLNASSSALQTNIDASVQPSQTGSFIIASQTGSFLTSVPEGTLSGSAQIAAAISGAFTADSASFSTRVTANDAKVSYTDAAVTNVINTAGVISSSAQLDFVDTTGTPAGNQLAVFTDVDTIKGASVANFTNEGGLIINNASLGADRDGITVHGNIFGSGSLIRLKNPKPSGGDPGFYLSASGDLAGGTFKIFTGDISNVGNSTLLTVDDENEQITTSKTLGVTGNITVTGTVDGRDVAADGTKLDGITAAGISGSFTTTSASFSTRVTANDAKLTANTSNVTSAGALMDSELAEIATVKALTKVGISGSFTAASSSFSTRVTANDAKVSYTDAAVTSVINTAGVISSSAQFGSSDNVTFGTIEATSLNVTSITSSIVTSSIVQTEGSNIFGDAISDTQTFNGHITASGNISASGDITAHSASFTGPVKISLATGGTALEITEEDEDQKGRLLFEYDDGNPTLTIASRASTAKLHIRQDAGTNGLYFDEDGQIYINNDTQDGVKIDGTSFSSIGTNANALDLGKMNRPWKDLYLTGDGANIFFQDNSTGPELTLNYPGNSNRLILSASDGRPSASFEVMGDISASGTIVGLNLSGTNTGDQDLSSYIQASQTGSFLTAADTGSLTTTAELNASSSALQTNIDTKATIAQLNASSSALQTNIDASIQPSQTGSFLTAADTGSLTTIAELNASSSALQTNIDASVQPSQTGSFVVASQTGSFLTAADTGSFITAAQTSSFSTATGVEDNADVTDTSNVTSAGALMDSELAEIATVKTLTAAGISGSFTAASASFSTRVSANDAKLTANTSNVTSAGALMDSELDEIATVKALTKAGISGSFTAASSSFSTRISANEVVTAKTLLSSSAQIASDISGSFTATSASFSTRVTANDAKLTANTSNVTSAGALMDSELAEIATIKTLTKAGISGSFTVDSASFSTRVSANEVVTAKTLISGSSQVSFNSISGLPSGLLSSSNDFVINSATSSFIVASQTGSFLIAADTGSLTTTAELNASSSALQTNIDAKVLNSSTASFAITGSSVLFGNITASGDISSSGTITAATLDAAAVSDTLAAAIVAEIDNDEIPVAKLAEDSISGVTLGGNLNNLTVDNATLQLNTGTTYNGSAARTISIKDGGVDSDALADDITVAGDLTVAGSIIHSGDTDTKIAFTTNAVKINAGALSVFESNTTGSVLPNVYQNIFDTGSVALAANSAFGDIVKFGGSSTVAGGLYYLKGDGTWALAQANAAGTSTGSLAVAVGTNSDIDGMCIRGFVNPFTDPGAGIGSPVYVSDTNPGRILATAPDSNNDVVRIIGHQYGTDLIYFNPSNDFIIVTA